MKHGPFLYLNAAYISGSQRLLPLARGFRAEDVFQLLDERIVIFLARLTRDKASLIQQVLASECLTQHAPLLFQRTREEDPSLLRLVETIQGV